MKKLFIIALCGLCAACAQPSMRILSFNVHNCSPAGSDAANYDAIAAYISEMKPEVVALQELDEHNLRHNESQIEELKQRTGMGGYWAKTIDYKDGGYGIGILYRQEPIAVSEVVLPGREPRKMVVAEFDNYFFISTHLCLAEENRTTSAEIINDYAASLQQQRKPIFMAGDFNTDDLNDAFFVQILERWDILNGEEPTHPNINARLRIDYIMSYRPTAPQKLTTTGRGVFKAEAVDITTLSDHLPIYVDLKF